MAQGPHKNLREITGLRPVLELRWGLHGRFVLQAIARLCESLSCALDLDPPDVGVRILCHGARGQTDISLVPCFLFRKGTLLEHVPAFGGVQMQDLQIDTSTLTADSDLCTAQRIQPCS